MKICRDTNFLSLMTFWAHTTINSDIESLEKQERLKTGIKIAVRTGLKSGSSCCDFKIIKQIKLSKCDVMIFILHSCN